MNSKSICLVQNMPYMQNMLHAYHPRYINNNAKSAEYAKLYDVKYAKKYVKEYVKYAITFWRMQNMSRKKYAIYVAYAEYANKHVNIL